MVAKLTSGRKPYKELTFTDDYMFCRILENDLELARQIVSLLIGLDVREVRLADPQHSISIDSDAKSVRLDVYLNDDEGTVFDLEMQTLRRKEIPKRSRYYQSIVDIDNLAAGMDYDMLPDVYIIFICTFDPFYSGLPGYSFSNRCEEDPEIELGDGTYKVYINATSESREITPEMRAFLDYVSGKEPASDLTNYIDESIRKAKSNRRWEREYVIVADMIKEERKEARAEGRDERQAEIRKLSIAMKNDGRREEFNDAIDDETGAALNALLVEYGIRDQE